ncbi:MAG: glycosyltransferase family 1 protein [Acidobacteriota bacterium]
MSHRIAIDARKIRDFGIGTYIRNLVRELAELDRENRYFLLTGPQGKSALQDLPDNFEIVLHHSPVYSLRELWATSFQLKRLGIDLYHATHYVLPLWLPCRTVVTIHDIIHLLYPEYLPNRLAHLYAEGMIRRGVQRGDRVITVSHNTRSDLRDYFGIEGRRLEVVYNGIERAFHDELSTDARDRKLKQLGLDAGYLLFVGNPKPHKNLDRVVRAYARAVELGDIDAPLVCVGDKGGIESRVRQRAEQLGIGDRVLLPGVVAQEVLPAIYQGARLFLYPTLYEGFGLPVVEAMASNVPVLTSKTSALQEIAAGYAHLVDPLDIESMAEGIVRILGDEEYHRSLARSGKRRSRDFDWRRAAERTHEIYRLALGGDKA